MLPALNEVSQKELTRIYGNFFRCWKWSKQTTVSRGSVKDQIGIDEKDKGRKRIRT